MLHKFKQNTYLFELSALWLSPGVLGENINPPEVLPGVVPPFRENITPPELLSSAVHLFRENIIPPELLPSFVPLIPNTLGGETPR